MRNLINFLLKNSSWFVFILLEILCFYFIFSDNPYQKSIFFNSSNEVTGRVYAVSGNVVSYFGLRSENQDLLEKNAKLQSELASLKKYIYTLNEDSTKTQAFINNALERSGKEQFIRAQVERNSISLVNNYITINKGANDGVEEDMGAISQHGIVGVVRRVSPNYAIIQPILNPHSQFSCKVLNSNTAGTLIWNGEDPRYAYLTEYPKYDRFELGDTIVTSGFSDFFPEGIMVGTIEDYKSETNDDFYSLKIKLSTDFGALKNVLLLKGKDDEQRKLEESILNVKK